MICNEGHLLCRSRQELRPQCPKESALDQSCHLIILMFWQSNHFDHLLHLTEYHFDSNILICTLPYLTLPKWLSLRHEVCDCVCVSPSLLVGSSLIKADLVISSKDPFLLRRIHHRIHHTWPGDLEKNTFDLNFEYDSQISHILISNNIKVNGEN